MMIIAINNEKQQYDLFDLDYTASLSETILQQIEETVYNCVYLFFRIRVIDARNSRSNVIVVP